MENTSQWDDVMDNPWNVTNLDEFLFYHCPECINFHVSSKSIFIDHALLTHPNVSTCIEILIQYGEMKFRFPILYKQTYK